MFIIIQSFIKVGDNPRVEQFFLTNLLPYIFISLSLLNSPLFNITKFFGHLSVPFELDPVIFDRVGVTWVVSNALILVFFRNQTKSHV